MKRSEKMVEDVEEILIQQTVEKQPTSRQSRKLSKIKQISIKLDDFKLPQSNVYEINFDHLSEKDKTLLAALLHHVANDDDISTLPKKFDIEINGKLISLELSHTLHKSIHADKPVFNIILPRKISKVGKGAFGIVKKFHRIIALEENGKIKFFNEARVNKKQVCPADIKESKFIENVNDEYIASQALYSDFTVDAPVFSRNKSGVLVANQSIPYLGVSVEKSNFSNLTIKKQLFAIENFLERLVDFHEEGFAHRDIKRDNVLFNEKNGILFLVDPGSAMLEGQEKVAAGTVFCMPPSYLDDSENKKVTVSDAQKVDVYAAGLTLFQLVGGESKDIKSIYANRGSNRETLFQQKINIQNSEVKKAFIELLMDMTNPDYHELPTMQECATRLKALNEPLTWTFWFFNCVPAVSTILTYATCCFWKPTQPYKSMAENIIEEESSENETLEISRQ